MSKVNNVFKTLFGEFLGSILLNFEHVCVFLLDQQITTFQSVQTGWMCRESAGSSGGEALHFCTNVTAAPWIFLQGFFSKLG